MARRGGTSTQRQAPEPVPHWDGNTNGLPPPSTIPAQIVHNAANLNAQQNTLRQLPFVEQVKAFLLKGELEDPDSVCIALVCTIAKGGIDPFFERHPFGPTQAELDELIVHSIAAFNEIFRRKPYLLLEPTHVEDEEEGPRPPIFIWLFPKLVGLLGYKDGVHVVNHHVQDLLAACLYGLETSDRAIFHAEAAVQLYKASVQCILQALELTEDVLEDSAPSVNIQIPPANSIANFWPEIQHLVVVPRDLQRTITTPTQAAYVGLRLLQTLLFDYSFARDRRYTNLYKHEQLRPWALEASTLLWKRLGKWSLPAGASTIRNEMQVLYMRQLDLLAFPKENSADDFTSSPRAALSLTSALLELLYACTTYSVSEMNQIDLASLFARLRSVSEMLSKSEESESSRWSRYKFLIVDAIQPAVAELCRDVTALTALHRDLQLALCLWTLPGNWSAEVEELRSALCSNDPEIFTSGTFSGEASSYSKIFRQLNLVEDERPAKRRRTLPESAEDAPVSLYNQLILALNGNSPESPEPNISALHQIVQVKYSNLPEDPSRSEPGQCELISAFAKIACAGSRSLRPSENGGWQEATCRVCDETDSQDASVDSAYWDRNISDESWKDAIAALANITREERFNKSSKPRVLMAVAVQRIFSHISDADYLGLETSPLGKWLVNAMTRSLRELRIAALRALMVFLEDRIPDAVRDKNRRAMIQFFVELTKRNATSLQETLIMAYGQAARTCSEVEREIVLGQLVDYLGHTNTVIYGAAFNELLSLSEHLKTSTLAMLRPYWKTIGFKVVSEIQNKPQKAQLLSYLVEMSVPMLLCDIHPHVIPILVLNKRKDVIRRIAKAKDTTVEDVCMQPSLARILALLLCQPGEDEEVERRAMDSLIAVAPGFRDDRYPLQELLVQESASAACEVLRMAADHDGSDKLAFYNGFNRIARLEDIRFEKRKNSVKSAEAHLEAFIRRHILGIIAQFSNIVEDPTSAHPLTERRRCVRAITELILVAGSNSSYALPQLRACLQSAMADVHLCDFAFKSWTTLLWSLDTDSLSLLIDQTFALIVQNWHSFSDDTRTEASKTLEALRRKHNLLLQERICYLPSLASIPMLSKLEAEIARLKAKEDPAIQLGVFGKRCNDENAIVVRQALLELAPFLETHQGLIHQSAISQKPLPALTALSRSLLDICVRFANNPDDVLVPCARCLGLIGGLDPYRIEAVREKKRILVLSNFLNGAEVLKFAGFMLEEVIIKLFQATSNTKAQGYLAYLMQELCKFSKFTPEFASAKERSSPATPQYQLWFGMDESIRTALTPFLNSRYTIRYKTKNQAIEYPLFHRSISHANWLRSFTLDLLLRAKDYNAKEIFSCIATVLKHQDLSIDTFILPFAVANAIIDGDEQTFENVRGELLRILEADVQGANHTEATNIKQCSENVFQILDYLVLWLQEKRKAASEARHLAGKTGRGISETEEMEAMQQISAVEGLLQLIPAKIISQRAVECGSYARALFHWEQYYREEQTKAEARQTYFASDDLLQHLQFIYAQIDEPDGLEGISAHLQVLNPEQQIMEHRKAGRWTAAQSWYELALADSPNDPETQVDLLTCLKESGQYDAILNYVDGFHTSDSASQIIMPFAAEAAWSTGKWDQLERTLTLSSGRLDSTSLDFNVGIGKALLALRQKNETEFKLIVEQLRGAIARTLTPTATASLHAAHEHIVKLHTLYELEAISGIASHTTPDREATLENLDRRLDILGTYISDKQYLLGVRRAAMQLSSIRFTNLDIASAWLTTSRLARKGDFTPAAFNSILHASQLGDDASKIEYSKMLWKQGHHRKAIQNLRGAISSSSFAANESVPMDVSVSVSTTTTDGVQAPNKVKSRALLLLAKWLDRAGQTQSALLKEEYARGIKTYARWDKGHYYLGRYYLKLYETEKALPLSKQAGNFVAGELTKLVIENYIRSTVYGSKYYYQTIPKILTLWLDMGSAVLTAQPKLPRDKDLHQHKLDHLDHINKYIRRYASERMPAYPWYTAFPQLITRISHPNKSVWEVLQLIILRVAGQYPQQALWSLLAVIHSTQDERRTRGSATLKKMTDSKKKASGMELRNLIIHGQQLTDALLLACDTPIEQRVSHVSLSRDLNFKMKLAPCALVVPIEATMIPTLPAGNDSRMIRAHNPFPQDAITIASFRDDVLVLSSLQRPRKIIVVGSDGREYGLLCKPKDDLRKDQRLMEFNAMINRALQRDIEASKRRMYIKTYGVTPLNEECGTIEWVEGLKPMRDIIIRLYRQKSIGIDYAEIRLLLNEASSDPAKTSIFTEKILKRFTPVLHEWFVETFPEPEAWFAARLRYTRSCAVMSIVGHVLGLGDRHGENVLLEEGNGGTFHVDFNCLFDKGLTFEKPELVPFRLTHNMVDAMGPAGVEGPFRKTAELTYSLLRQHEDTLITILETFVHDPTADFLGGKRKKKIPGVADTPQEVLEIVRSKLGGFVRGESVPLSVEGYVDSLVTAARDPRNLAAMYIGWCAFF